MSRQKLENTIYLFEHIDQQLADRFWSKVDMSGNCWLWMGGKTSRGYGNFSVGPAESRKLFMTHRVALALSGETDIAGMEVCHHCDNPSCVRPEHLFIGTKSDNMRDMRNKGRGNTRWDTCKQGHSLTDEANIYSYPDGRRICKTCNRDRYRASKAGAEGSDVA